MNGGGRCSTDTTLDDDAEMPDLTDASVKEPCNCSACQENDGQDGPDHDAHAGRQMSEEEEIDSLPPIPVITPTVKIDDIIIAVQSDTTSHISANDSLPSGVLVMDESALAAQLLATDSDDAAGDSACEILSQEF